MVKTILYFHGFASSSDSDKAKIIKSYISKISKKIKYFDPGVQGEHKIRRGFEPKRTSSFHYIKENDFRNAIIEFCDKEEVEINRYLKACERYTPFNKEYKI